MEKWNLRFNPTSVDAQHVPEEFLREIVDIPPFEISELEKTEDEQVVIRDLNMAAERALSSLKLAPFHVAPEYIHIVTQEAYRTIPSWRETSRALTNYGHIYISRPENPESNAFITSLSHEISHALSFYLHNVITTPLPSGETNVHIRTKRTGFHFWALEGKEYSGFEGVNEALTELFAGRIRVIFADIRKLSKSEKYTLQLTESNTFAVVLLKTLFSRFGGKEPRRIKNDYLRASMTGDISILRQLERRRKGSVKALAEMSPSLDDCRKAAHVLGIQNEYEENIKHLFDTTHDDGKQE